MVAFLAASPRGLSLGLRAPTRRQWPAILLFLSQKNINTKSFSDDSLCPPELLSTPHAHKRIWSKASEGLVAVFPCASAGVRADRNQCPFTCFEIGMRRVSNRLFARGWFRFAVPAALLCIVVRLAWRELGGGGACRIGRAVPPGVLTAPSASASLERRGVEERWATFRSCVAPRSSHIHKCSSEIALPAEPLPFATLEAHYHELLAATRDFRGRTPHCHSGFGGPWLENAWIDTFGGDNLTAFYPLVPLFVQSTDICVSGDAKLTQSLADFFAHLRPDVLYVTVTQHDEGLCFLPDAAAFCAARNVLILSAGGWGHVALPLVKGIVQRGDHGGYTMPSHTAIKAGARQTSYLLGFAGLLDTHPGGFRREVITALRQTVGLSRDDQLVTFSGGDEWRGVMADTALPLAPRGFGRSSFRTAELVQLGLPQAVIWNDVPWLPYYDPAQPQRAGRTTVWGAGGIGIHSDMHGLAALVAQLCVLSLPQGLDRNAIEAACPLGALPAGPPYVLDSTSELARMASRATALAQSHFSLPGIMDRVREFLVSPADVDLVCVPLPRTKT